MELMQERPLHYPTARVPRSTSRRKNVNLYDYDKRIHPLSRDKLIRLPSINRKPEPIRIFKMKTRNSVLEKYVTRPQSNEYLPQITQKKLKHYDHKTVHEVFADSLREDEARIIAKTKRLSPPRKLEIKKSRKSVQPSKNNSDLGFMLK